MKYIAPRVVPGLDIESLPAGRISRLWIDLTEDGLGLPVRLPVMVARGNKPGPVFGLTAAVHGDELNGIPIIHRLFDHLELSTLRGSVVAVVVVNIDGFLSNERRFGDGWDLNHSFPGRPDGNAAEVYTYRVVDQVLRELDVLVDLHTASFGRANSLYIRADMTDPVTAEMAYLLRPQIVVHNPPSDRTLRGAAAELGIPAMTVEVGNPNRFNQDYIRRALAGLRAVLAAQGMIRKRQVTASPPPILCRGSYWIYTDRGGLLEVYPRVADSVSEGDEIGRITDPFGQRVATYRAPEDGVVIGRAINPVASTGARILHLGQPLTDADTWFRPPLEQEGP